MMHKAAPFTASCNGLIDMDDETDEVADPAGTVFSGVNPSHLIIEVRSKASVNATDEYAGDCDDDCDDGDDGGGAHHQHRKDKPENQTAKSDPTGVCAALVAALVLVPLLHSQRECL